MLGYDFPSLVLKEKKDIEIGNRGKYMTGHLTGDEVGHSLPLHSLEDHSLPL